MKRAPCVLTIAGSDSGAGAGLQADSRTIHALGGFALTVVTAVTAQNTRGVRQWSAVAPGLLRAQLAAVLDDFPIGAIKTGLLPGTAAMRALVSELAARPAVPLVVDPVIGSTSGTRFLPPAALASLKRELLPRATLVTPNWPEAEALTRRKISSFETAELAARALADEARCAVLLKGGHGPAGRVCRDVLVHPGGDVHWFDGRKIETPNTHGTGCVLSAAIATQLAHGRKLERAVALARAFLVRSLARHRHDRWGGAGPAFPG